MFYCTLISCSARVQLRDDDPRSILQIHIHIHSVLGWHVLYLHHSAAAGGEIAECLQNGEHHVQELNHMSTNARSDSNPNV